jgi:hypothetical protein
MAPSAPSGAGAMRSSARSSSVASEAVKVLVRRMGWPSGPSRSPESEPELEGLARGGLLRSRPGASGGTAARAGRGRTVVWEGSGGKG